MSITPQMLLSGYCQGIFPMAEGDEVYWYGLILHFGHGIIGAIFLGLIIEQNIFQLEIINGLFYGFFLWLILLSIHKPITNESLIQPFPNRRLLNSFISHLIYGLTLVIL